MYNFDEIINREATNSINYENYRKTLFGLEKDIKLPFPNKDIIRMWVADMEIKTPEFILSAIKERLDKKILGYTDFFNDDYYNAFSSWCKRRYKLTLNKNEIFTSDGLVSALKNIVSLIGEKDKKAIILTPSYAPFKGACSYNGIKTVFSDLVYKNGGFEIDFSDFEKKVSDKSVNILIMCNPHNPTGRVWSYDELNKIGEICVKNNLWIISDEIHCDLTRTNISHTSFLNVLPNYNKLITCFAPSKTFNLAGMKFSNVIIRDENIKRLWLKRFETNKNPLSIAAAQSAYINGYIWLDELRQYLDENFKAVLDILNKNTKNVKMDIPESTYLGWCNISSYLPKNKNINTSVLFGKYGGVIVEDEKFFLSKGNKYIRINLACPKAYAIEGANRIVKVLNMIEGGEIDIENDESLLY